MFHGVFAFTLVCILGWSLIGLINPEIAAPAFFRKIGQDKITPVDRHDIFAWSFLFTLIWACSLVIYMALFSQPIDKNEIDPVAEISVQQDIANTKQVILDLTHIHIDAIEKTNDIKCVDLALSNAKLINILANQIAIVEQVESKDKNKHYALTDIRSRAVTLYDRMKSSGCLPR